VHSECSSPDFENGSKQLRGSTRFDEKMMGIKKQVVGFSEK